jgi:topoisomerase-4 subunit A
MGDPLTKLFKLPMGASFIGCVMPLAGEKVLMISDAGYGFIATFDDLISKNKNGKSALKVPAMGKALVPCTIANLDKDWIVCVSNVGRLLVVKASECPILAKGKGNKLINILTKDYKDSTEFCAFALVLKDKSQLRVYSGKRYLTLKPKDWQAFVGERGRRGQFLPRGYRRVDSVSVESKG